MSINVIIEKQSQVVHTHNEPLAAEDLPALLAALKSAKQKTNEFLTKLVEIEKTPAKDTSTKDASGKMCRFHS